ncbi:MAG TPA: carboxypeptidase-like regulatory domain-containing protein [Candidatus Dormibacteraeota bacterium]|jgi:protocatechuate 3,4-dioxygenase beta subunit|nr:carboxypeptidase-like regulatory domain-containing protein [Candidatus Dormibacteraeota bacterium]
MKVFSAALLWLIVLAVAALSAQTSLSSGAQTSSPTHATLSGIVTKDPGSEPVKKALIELIAESQSDGGNYTAVTGADGGFHIENIAPGRYHMFVERTGYQEIDKHHRRTDGRVLTLSAGQELKDLVIRLQAAAVVEGRVTDEDGDPMPEAQVAILRQSFVAGRSHWEQVGAERTNDLGEYRIPSLAAGNYFVSVTPPPDFRTLIETSGNPTSVLSGNVAAEKPAPVSYQTTYYPGTRDRGQAAPIQLHAGDDFPANFSLTPGPSLIIRGSVVNLLPGSTAAIMLQSKDFNLMLNGAEMHKDGTFEIRDVAPGAYTIIATADNSPVPMMARQALQLTTGNVEGLRLAPQPGGSIRGRLRMETSGNSRPDPGQIFLALRSVDADDDAFGTFAGGVLPVATHVSADGSFEWNNIPAGHYSVQISEASALPDWFVKSVAASGRDAADSGFSLSGSTMTLDLVVSSNGAAAEGAVTNQPDEPEKDTPVADAVVVAVPEPRFRSHPDRYRKALTDQHGHFTLRGLPTGDYTLFAWESVEGDAYYDAQFLRNYESQGKTLHVNQGDRASIQLKAIPAAEDEP